MRLSTLRRVALMAAGVLVAAPSFAQLSGTLYIGNPGTKPGGGNPEYATIKAAFDAVNAQGLNGNLLLSITSDLTEAADVRLGVNTGGFTLTLKPAAGVQPVVSFTDTQAPAGSDPIWGNMVIGSPTALGSNLIPTNNVILDGSNTVGGVSRDMKFIGPNTTSGKSIIRAVGDNDYLTIKNIQFETLGTQGTGLIQVSASTNLVSDNLTIKNNKITNVLGTNSSGIVFGRFGSGVPTVSATGQVVTDNEIIVRRRGFDISYRDSGEFARNTVTIQPGTADSKGFLCYTAPAGATGTMNVYSNRFEMSTSSATGMMGVDNQIDVATVTVNVYNNTFANFSTTAAATNQRIFAVRHAFGAVTNAYHNSVYLNDLTDLSTPGTTVIAAFAFVSNAVGNNTSPTGTMRVMNNAVRLAEGTMASSGILRGGTTGTFESESNVFHTEGATSRVGTANNVALATLDAWRDATLQDANSRQRTINFTSTTDLTLSAPSLGNADFAGKPVAMVTTDAIGTTRSTTAPYIGAFEGAPSLSPRIMNFTAGLSGNATAPAWNAAGAIFWAYYPTQPGRGVTVELHPVGNAGNYVRFACTYNNTAGPAGSNYRCQVWPTASVPDAFKNATVEYQFMTSDYGTTKAERGSSPAGPRTNDADFTGFNWTFSTAADGAPLPVELTAFQAVTAGQTVQLTWTTASETNNTGFYVEQLDGSSYKELGFVAGQGTTTEAHDYRFDAVNLASGRHTFRLRQVDTDGRVTYSPTVEAAVEMDADIEVSAPAPNPFSTSSRFTVRLPQSQNVAIDVYDVTGRLVQSLHNGMLQADEAHAFSVDGAGLTGGLYLVRIQGEHVTRTLRVTVAR